MIKHKINKIKMKKNNKPRTKGVYTYIYIYNQHDINQFHKNQFSLWIMTFF